MKMDLSSKKMNRSKRPQENSINDMIASVYKRCIDDTKSSNSMFSKSNVPSTLSKVQKPSRIKNESLPYGFRTLDSFKDLTNAFREHENGQDLDRGQTLYTERAIKEYYTSEGSMPSRLFYETMFKPNANKKHSPKSYNKKKQDELVERLYKHKDKVRAKNKLNQINQDMIMEEELKPSQPQSKVKSSPKLSNSSLMYDNQMKLETQRKARMYDLAVQEYMTEIKSMKQAKACPKSNRLLSKQDRKGSIHNRLYKSGIRKQSKDATRQSLDHPHQKLPFKPRINTVSINLTREGKIEDRLINEAKRQERKRMKKSNDFMVKSMNSSIKNSKSTNIVFKNFSKEYESLLFDMGKDKGDGFTNDELTMILYKMGFITQSSIGEEDSPANDIWIILGGETQEQVMETSVFNIMCIMQNMNYPFLYSEKYLTPSKNNVV